MQIKTSMHSKKWSSLGTQELANMHLDLSLRKFYFRFVCFYYLVWSTNHYHNIMIIFHAFYLCNHSGFLTVLLMLFTYFLKYASEYFAAAIFIHIEVPAPCSFFFHFRFSLLNKLTNHESAEPVTTTINTD
jgi:hypothetical protein